MCPALVEVADDLDLVLLHEPILVLRRPDRACRSGGADPRRGTLPK
jgi:hypothetical protein